MSTQFLFYETNECIYQSPGHRQKDRIRDRSQRLADEIEDFINKKRQEAAELTYEVLNKAQRERLLEIIGPKELNRANNVPIEKLWRFFHYADDSRNLHEHRSMDLESSTIWKKR